MQSEIVVSLIFLVFRIAAAVQVVIQVIGLLWFANYYFSLQHIMDTAIAITPTLVLVVGILAPDKLLRITTSAKTVLIILTLGVVCLIASMYQAATLVNGVDYGALEAELTTMGLIFVFMLRVFYFKTRTA